MPSLLIAMAGFYKTCRLPNRTVLINWSTEVDQQQAPWQVVLNRAHRRLLLMQPQATLAPLSTCSKGPKLRSKVKVSNLQDLPIFRDITSRWARTFQALNEFSKRTLRALTLPRETSSCKASSTTTFLLNLNHQLDRAVDRRRQQFGHPRSPSQLRDTTIHQANSSN